MLMNYKGFLTNHKRVQILNYLYNSNFSSLKSKLDSNVSPKPFFIFLNGRYRKRNPKP